MQKNLSLQLEEVEAIAAPSSLGVALGPLLGVVIAEIALT